MLLLLKPRGAPPMKGVGKPRSGRDTMSKVKLWAGLWIGGLAAAAAAGCLDARDTPAFQSLGGEELNVVPPDEGLGCAHPKPGCPCGEDGRQVACGSVDLTLGNQHVCGAGLSVCSGGRWGECIINNTVTLVPDQSGTSGSFPALLGEATPCMSNPCDPNCVTFPDDPTGVGAPDAGIVGNSAGVTLAPPSDDDVAFDAGCTGGVLASCAHSVCSAGVGLATGCDGTLGCVAKVCQAHPSCCAAGWGGSCVAWALSLCNIGCGSQAGVCVVCYKDSVDHDGDGWSFAQGDCADCDPAVNPGAYDFPGNGLDEDCTGTPDDAPASCDTDLAMASSKAFDFVKAVDLCRTTTATATGATKTWGVVSAALVQADGSSTPSTLSHGILPRFGASNLPQKGSRMAAFSSGTARAPGDPGWFDPNGQATWQQGYAQGTSCAYPPGFPKNKAGCPKAGGKANDSSGLLMRIRVPTNAKSFSYRFNFFTSEYPEWVCTAYNDSFVALLQSSYQPANPASNSNNISFDSAGNPVNVNIGFFTVVSGPALTGTGMEGKCANPFTGKKDICGGSTGWLETSAPVVPGETIQMELAIWDASDRVWDSIVLVDDFTWSGTTATIQTGVAPKAPAATYTAGTFARDFDATDVCPDGMVPVWGLWSWNSRTPSDSSIAFTVQTAATQAALDDAPADPLLFTNPPGPSARAGEPVVASTTSGTGAGSALVDATFAANGRMRNNSFVRVSSRLIPSTDKLSAPVLSAWNLSLSCAAND